MCANFKNTQNVAAGLASLGPAHVIGRSASRPSASSIAMTERMCTLCMSCVPSVYFVAACFGIKSPKPDEKAWIA